MSQLAFTQMRTLMKQAGGRNAELLCAEHLNTLQAEMFPSFAYQFIEQQTIASTTSHKTQDDRYYEHIIYEDKCIPTRKGSVHDYFNGLIWLQFEQCKAFLNTLHWRDIARYGSKKRSAKRDKATHFDECGILLISDLPELKQRLAAHDWHWLFVEKRECWFRSKDGIIPLHFGHATLELLCKPFLGLTAKALVIHNARLLEMADDITVSPSRFNIFKDIDMEVVKYLQEQSVFDLEKPFLPLPILGIPSWHFATQDKVFYENTQYFMPHRDTRSR